LGEVARNLMMIDDDVDWYCHVEKLVGSGWVRPGGLGQVPGSLPSLTPPWGGSNGSGYKALVIPPSTAFRLA
jgi:hypothetical protein